MHLTTLRIDEEQYQNWQKLHVPAGYVFGMGLRYLTSWEQERKEMEDKVDKLTRALVTLQNELLKSQIRDKYEAKPNDIL